MGNSRIERKLEKQALSKDEVIEKCQENNVLFIRLQFLDILGVPKNIVIPSQRL